MSRLEFSEKGDTVKDHVGYRISGLVLMLLGAFFLLMNDFESVAWKSIPHWRLVFYITWMGVAMGGGFAMFMFSFKLDPNRPPPRPRLGCPKCGGPIAMQVPFIHMCP